MTTRRINRLSLLEPVVQFSVTSQEALKTEKPGGVAQLGEHLPCKQGVMGSIPIISTKSEGNFARETRIT